MNRKKRKTKEHVVDTRLLNSLEAIDIAHVLHPYTNARRLAENGPLIVDRGDGIRVYDRQGKDYIEGFGGLWCVALGFSEQRLIDAAVKQFRKLPYYHNFAYKSHTPSIELAERLTAIAPGNLSHVFFTNSGSEANDTAVKLVWYYNNAIGRAKKKKVVSRLRAYHGITVASGSLTGLPANHRDFDLPIANILHTACPDYWRLAKNSESEEDFALRLANEFEELILREGPETVAAFIGEPVMGAGGVIVPPRTYWQKMQAVCRKYDILLIADEVVTGFGRTGRMFGCETFNITPDIMVLSKQLTSGYQPLSAILFSDALYVAIADNTAKVGTFGHGFTAGGHPVATAVALENLRIIEERRIVEHAAAVSVHFQRALKRFADHPLVGSVRGIGLMGAVELVADKATKKGFDPPGRAGQHLAERCEQHGLIVRGIGDAAALSPPLIIEPAEIEVMFERFARALEDTATAIM
jgi:4-aminobutyrate--pyruvate transaminase